MSTPEEVEGRTTAIAIVRSELEGDRGGFLALLRGSESPEYVMSSLVMFAADVVKVLAAQNGMHWRPMLEKLAILANLDDDEPA